MRADSNVDWTVSVDVREAKSSWELSEKKLVMPKNSNASVSDITALWINNEMGKSHSAELMKDPVQLKFSEWNERKMLENTRWKQWWRSRRWILEVWLPIIVDILCEELKIEKNQRQLPIPRFKHKIGRGYGS